MTGPTETGRLGAGPHTSAVPRSMTKEPTKQHPQEITLVTRHPDGSIQATDAALRIIYRDTPMSKAHGDAYNQQFNRQYTSLTNS